MPVDANGPIGVAAAGARMRIGSNAAAPVQNLTAAVDEVALYQQHPLTDADIQQHRDALGTP